MPIKTVSRELRFKYCPQKIVNFIQRSSGGMLKALNLKMLQSLTLTEAYSKSCLPLFIAVFLFCWEKAEMVEPYVEICYLWTRSEIRFRFTWEQYSLGPVRK